jgi:Lon protease-like protein
MTLPLHIFEERYRLMIGRCIQEESEFGILLIRNGSEVGGGAEPVEIGTLARITEVNELPDGRLNIVTEGTRRFRVVDFSYEQPYLSGDVETLDDEPIPTPEDVVEESRKQFEAYVRLLLALAGQWQREFELPGDADELSYSIASALKIDMPAKQELLEEPFAGVRLQAEREILERECGRLRKLVTHKWQNNGGTGYPVN